MVARQHTFSCSLTAHADLMLWNRPAPLRYLLRVQRGHHKLGLSSQPCLQCGNHTMASCQHHGCLRMLRVCN
jgi:hypothetical protein